MEPITLPTWYYQQFDADGTLDVPGEGYGGWKQVALPLAPEHTALVVMHAWDCGTREEFPGWFRCVEYLPRADAICRTVFPELLSAMRNSPMKLFHVAGEGAYLAKYPGHQRTVELAGPEPPKPLTAHTDPVVDDLWRFKGKHVFVGEHNQEDVKRGFARLDFPTAARPLDHEPIATTSHQLFALCREHQIDHLIYAGFAINVCLQNSPGGMVDMSRRGLMCSALRQAVTAVENKESARHETHKETALWWVSIAFGYVYDVSDFVTAVKGI
ncbi:MAG: hypothetical protein ACYDBB_17930 [Armatimonadota bacterium]